MRRVPAFYDTYTIEKSSDWHGVIDRCAKGSRVFVAIFR
jgi:hypothetical protein